MALTVFLTKSSVRSFTHDLKVNGVPYFYTSGTRVRVEPSPKVNLAIRLVKERFGIRSIKVVED